MSHEFQALYWDLKCVEVAIKPFHNLRYGCSHVLCVRNEFLIFGPLITAVGSVGVLSVARAMVSFDRMLRASQSLHDDMIHAVLRAPIR